MGTKEQKELRRLLRLEISMPMEAVSMTVSGHYVRDTVWKLPNGRIQRDFGPAVTFENGKLAWYQHGSLHREDGQAVIEEGGRVDYYLLGVLYKKKEWIKELNKNNNFKSGK